MTRHPRRTWPLAVALAALAGATDAVGFLRSGGLFVSFMSGNSTRLAVGIVTGSTAATVAASLIAAFVAGVTVGALVGARAGRRRKPVVLAGVAVLLTAAALAGMGADGRIPVLLMAAAMGMENGVFQRDGEVSIGVTYMTGTLVKLGQRLAIALSGGPRWAWLPFLSLWSGLVAGAIGGGLLHLHAPALAPWVLAGTAALLAAWAAMLGKAAV